MTLHALCSVLSYVSFLVACLSGALFLLQERQLKQKQMGVLFHRLPSLGALDRINVVALGSGLALLTIGLLFGIWESRRLAGRWWMWDPSEIMTAVLWSSYLGLWLVRLRATLRGRKVALLSMLGFTFALFTLLGVSRWLPSWHTAL